MTTSCDSSIWHEFGESMLNNYISYYNCGFMHKYNIKIQHNDVVEHFYIETVYSSYSTQYNKISTHIKCIEIIICLRIKEKKNLTCL